MKAFPKILITGVPEVGKTTLIENILQRIPPVVLRAGFITIEERGKKGRTGFILKDLAGGETPFASSGKGKGRRVGKYLVDVDAFEEAALKAISFRTGVKLYVIDEIGPMEIMSRTFCESTKMLLRNDSVAVLASVAKSGHGFVKEVKRLSMIKILEVTPQNRESLADELALEFAKTFVDLLKPALTESDPHQAK